MSDQGAQESDLLHDFKNHLAIVVGFCDLLLSEFPETDPRRADIVEIHKAARAALAMMPALSQRLR